MRELNRQTHRQKSSENGQRNELIAAKAEIDNLENIIAELKSSLTLLQSSKDKEILRLENENTTLKESVSALEDKLEDKISTINKLQKEVNSTDIPSTALAVIQNKELTSKDVKKLFTGLMAESKEQKSDTVILSRMDMVVKYDVNQSKVSSSLKALANHNFIEIIKDGHSNSKTKYKILNKLPI
ncbi:hypothetical protein [Halobacteriovorax sp. CON-3]|uniref:hypothetical protein n=1 Tax=Halobacteriovorax sp. CON-3 TaxID=3157710 RepID=UPI0037126C50